MTDFTPSTSSPARAWIARRTDDLIVLAAGLGLALPFLVPLS